MTTPLYTPRYTSSRALLVGIDRYKNAPPLGYAVSDARAVADVLRNQFKFLDENVTLLVNEEATRENILEHFLSFADGNVAPDDRILFFFAGHGHTLTGSRGEVGFLVPVDGNPQKIASLVRWDELTRNADLIPAKHLLFVMDACYGGLAITRALPAGSMRFLKDMLVRPSRQVLTAGKANEVVADSGGPVPGHSIFTGHFLEALSGKAAGSEGIITANGVMTYVYEQVGRDQNSHQTPHYGFLAGDGDFIFAASFLTADADSGEKEQDVLVAVPTPMTAAPEDESASDLQRVKSYLAEPRDKIRLDDLIAQKTRALLPALSSPNFSSQAPVSVGEIPERLKRYESLTDEMRAFVSVLSYWGREEHRPTLRKPLIRLCDQLRAQGGSVAWIGLRWFPIDMLAMAGAISALAARNYSTLATVMLSGVTPPDGAQSSVPLVIAIEEGLIDAHRTDVFKKNPGHERNYVPKSEYLFKALQPQLDDLFFLGNDYEEMFDYAEVLRALVVADHFAQTNSHFWAPWGRFAWKHRRGNGRDPFTRVVEEATRQGSNWGPIGVGFFGGDIHRFVQVAQRLADDHLKKLTWF